MVILLGMIFSMALRWRGVHQTTVMSLMVAVMVGAFSYGALTGLFNPAEYLLGMVSGRNAGPSAFLAWFLLLYSFGMVSDDVVSFSVVPSIALIGVLAADNLNPEIVVYFLGMVTSAVFLLVYENMLSRGLLDADGALPPARLVAGPGRNVLSGVEPAVRASLMLTAVVAMVALVAGLILSVPLSRFGEAVNTRGPQFNLPAASEFAAAVSDRYVNQLLLDGAPPNLSDRVVMKVHSTEPHYWRGRVFFNYTGYGWSPEGVTRPLAPEGGEPYVFNRERVFPEHLFRVDRALGPEESSARRGLYQVVEMMDPPVAGMLVTAAEPEAFRIRRSSLVEYPGRSVAVHRSRPGMVYKAWSRVSTATPEQLRKAGVDYPVSLYGLNTQLEANPSDAPPARHALAVKITAPYDNPYDKVKALESYLRENYTYSLTPPRTPRSADAVAFFLTESKQGYCEIFASSMAVLAREVGIPARLATGFAPGEWHPGQGDSLGYALVREQDLHAWTEVFFPGYGWIGFDPTASREAQVSWFAAMRNSLREFIAGLTQYRSGSSLVILALIAVFAYLVKSYGLDPLRRSLWWRGLFASCRGRLPVDERWNVLYARAHYAVGRYGPAKSQSETPLEFADRVRRFAPAGVADLFTTITDLYVSRAFGRGGPTEDDADRLRAMIAELRAVIRSSRGVPAARTVAETA